MPKANLPFVFEVAGPFSAIACPTALKGMVGVGTGQKCLRKTQSRGACMNITEGYCTGLNGLLII